jgi:hypothetical protein
MTLDLIYSELTEVKTLLQSITTQATVKPLTTEDVLRRHPDLTKQILYNAVHLNELPAYRRGKRLFFKQSDLDGWMLGKKRTGRKVEGGAHAA